jgi:hypothetical protein
MATIMTVEYKFSLFYFTDSNEFISYHKNNRESNELIKNNKDKLSYLKKKKLKNK